MRRLLLPVSLIALAAVPCGAQAPYSAAAYALAEAGDRSLTPLAGTVPSFGLEPDGERLTPAQARAFRASQLEQERVRAASDRVGHRVAARFEAAGLPYPTDVLFRVFKSERLFEVWGWNPAGERYELVRNYPVCAVSGHLGPKTRRGDAQMPEGFYAIDLFNPWSRFHLSMRVNYPNESDRARRRWDHRLGGDIFVHGGCATVGCVPVTDDVIEELYVLAVDARGNGQASIPIHIYPSRMEGAGMSALWQQTEGDWTLWRFWLTLKAGYDHFQTHQREPEISVDSEGFYRFGV